MRCILGYRNRFGAALLYVSSPASEQPDPAVEPTV
jgi:hypothetical protein